MPSLPMERIPPGCLHPVCIQRERTRLYRMMTCLDVPRYSGFSTYSSRLRSFGKKSWPHPKRSPNSFRAAGFFYTGKDLCIRAAKTNINRYSFSLQYIIQYLSIYRSFIAFQGTLMKHSVSIVAGVLRAGSMMMMTHGRNTQNVSRTASTFFK